MKWIGVAFGVLMAVAAAIYLAPDGSQSSGREARAMRGQPQRAAATVEPACDSGSISLGREPGSIDFDVSCGPSNLEEGRFVVTRYSLDNHQGKSGIRMVQAGPRGVAGEGKPDVRCYLRKGNVLCAGRHESRHEVHGRLWVDPGEECKKGVAIYVVQSPECPEGACRLSFDIRYLAKGRPGGC